MGFQIRGLAPEDIGHLHALDESAWAAAGAVALVVDQPHAYPCRVSLEDAKPGERVLLFPYTHQPAATPYRASGPIFVRLGARPACIDAGQVPDALRRRDLSVRAYDRRHWIVAAEVTPGHSLESVIERMFADPEVAYLHVHNARPGCYAARVERAEG